MFGNQLAMLSLLLVGLSLSNLSNLSEAARSEGELLQMLLTATDSVAIKGIFEELGEPFKVYADLSDVRVENCTPERILFRTNFGYLFGPGVERYIATMVTRQQELCEDTFTDRLTAGYNSYQENWLGKEHFQQFLRFVRPWPTLKTQTHEMLDSIIVNIETYIKWRMKQQPEPRSRTQVYNWLIQSSLYVYQLLGGFLASFKTGRPFQPDLSLGFQHALALAQIAEAVRV